MKDRRICLDDDILMSDYRDLQQENEELLKYKNAWEELTETLTHYFELEFADTNVQAFMKELEEKHKVGV